MLKLDCITVVNAEEKGVLVVYQVVWKRQAFSASKLINLLQIA